MRLPPVAAVAVAMVVEVQVLLLTTSEPLRVFCLGDSVAAAVESSQRQSPLVQVVGVKPRQQMMHLVHCCSDG
jgi:hypothetical protein